MHFHFHRSGGQSASVLPPALPPVPDTTSADLRFLPPELVSFRREKGKLHMHCDAWPREEKPVTGEPEAGASEKAGQSPGESQAGAGPEAGRAPTIEDQPAEGGEEEPEGEAADPAEQAQLPASEESRSGPGEPAAENAPPPGAEVEDEADGEWRKVLLVRLFPLTEPERWISVLDEKGREVGIIEDLRRLSRQDAQLAREELERRYLVPQITAIVACRDRFDLTEWTVETDRGRTTFTTRNARESARRPLPNRLVLVDVEGNRFDIPDVEALDPVSRRLLDERL